MSVEGLWPKSDGDDFYASEANMLRLFELYSGTGYDSSQSGIGTNEDNHELNALTSAQIKGSNYVRIRANFTIEVSPSGGTPTVSMKIQAKETGGGYSDDMAYKIVFRNNTVPVTSSKSLTWVHTLTVGEKTNGVQFNIFSKSVAADNPGCSGSFTNIQTTVELIG